MSATIFTAVFGSGGRTSRYGEFTVVFMDALSFITTPMEFQQVTMWARSRQSCGRPQADRMAFVARFETVLARSGTGVATRGNRKQLSTIVKSMKANAMSTDEWNIPLNLDESMEIKRKLPKEPVLDATALPAAEPPAS